jgi:hypothetical protein
MFLQFFVSIYPHFFRSTFAPMDNPQTSTCSAGDLTDDLIVEILSRLPPKSICRFKCVSWHWYGLITDPEHRKKTPQTLSDFFYPSHRSWTPNDFVNVVGGTKIHFQTPR